MKNLLVEAMPPIKVYAAWGDFFPRQVAEVSYADFRDGGATVTLPPILAWGGPMPEALPSFKFRPRGGRLSKAAQRAIMRAAKRL